MYEEGEEEEYEDEDEDEDEEGGEEGEIESSTDDSGEEIAEEDKIEKLISEHDFETEQSVANFTSTIVNNLLFNLFPEKPRKLSLREAMKGLKNLGKIWNLAEYPPGTVEDEKHCKKEEKLMDMDGFIDEYQFLSIEAVDMGLTNIKVIPRNYPWLLTADLSGNRLNNKTACPMTTLRNLVALKLNRNQISDPYLAPMKHLQYLGLNNNQIESLHRIYHPNLETLDLNFNLIREVDPRDCWKHTKLNQLELRGNKLRSTRGIEFSSLVKLYLGQNRITKLEGLHILVNLQVLHLRDNPLSDLNGFSKSNINLKYLNVRQCRIERVEEFFKLRELTGLKELILTGNIFNSEPKKEKDKKKKKPGRSEEDLASEDEIEEDEEEKGEGDYTETSKDEDEDVDEAGEIEDEETVRLKILSYLPQLTRINKKVVTREELHNMKDMLEKLSEEEVPD